MEGVGYGRNDVVLLVGYLPPPLGTLFTAGS